MPTQPFRKAFDWLRRDLRSALTATAGRNANVVKRTNVVITSNASQDSSQHFAEGVQVAPVRQKRRER